MYSENKELNLLASVALFSELYNSPRYNNIFDIVAAFIKATVVSERKWTVSSLEITTLLKKNYDFNIPESIVRSVIKTKLKDVAKPSFGAYLFDESIEGEYKTMDEDYQRISSVQKAIISNLYEFIESKDGPLGEEDKQEVVGDLNKYLLDSVASNKYSAYISTFIVKSQSVPGFTESLNLITEGIILYQGIRYTANVGDLGAWKNELTIFLNTEQLFHAVGYNGELHKKIFFDFYDLVREVNNHSRNKGEKNKISLAYFEETKQEAENFFKTVEQVAEGKKPMIQGKTAMELILKDCKRASDVVNKLVAFFAELNGLGIHPYEHKGSIYDYPEYLVEDQKVTDSLKAEAYKKSREFNEKEAMAYFRMFSKINYLRKGRSNVGFEKVGFLMMTVNGFALYLGNNNKVKFDDNATRFAMSSDFVTSRLWFKLQRGLGINGPVPTAFNVVTKAQIVLATQVAQAVQQGYQALQQDFNSGKLTKEMAQERAGLLRGKATLPEHITEENVDQSLSFLTDEQYFEDLIREREMKDGLLTEYRLKAESLQKELDRNMEERRAAEDADKLRLKLLEKARFVEEKFKSIIKEYKSDALYYLKKCGLAFIAICAVVLIKYVEPVKKWFDNLPNWSQELIWGIIVLLLFWDVLQRSYLADKERVKRGRRWAFLLFQPKKRGTLKQEIMDGLGEKFDQDSTG